MFLPSNIIERTKMKILSLIILLLTSLNIFAAPNMQPTLFAYYQHDDSTSYYHDNFSKSEKDNAHKTCDQLTEEVGVFEEHVMYGEHSHKKTFLGVDIEILKGALTVLSLGVNI